MDNSNQKGFSLVELLIVVVIVGLIASMAVPYLQKAVGRAENTKGYAGLKVLSKAQVDFYSRNNRYARLNELRADAGANLGTLSGSNLVQGVFTLTMNPTNPTNNDLLNNYEVVATKAPTLSKTPCVISVDASGMVTEVFANGCINFD